MVVKFEIRNEGLRGGLRRKTRLSRRSNLLNLPQEIMLNILSRLPYESVLDCRRVCKSLRNLLLFHDNTYFTDMHLYQQSRQFVCDNQYHHHHQHENYNINNFNPDTKMSFVSLGGKDSLYYVEYDENNVQSYRKHKRMNLPLPDDVYRVIGSCNGLICLSVEHGYFIQDPVYICNPITREFLHLPRFILNKNNKHEFSVMAHGFGYHPSTNEYKVVRIYYDVEHRYTDSVGQVQVYTLGSGVGWRSKGEITHRFSTPYISGVLFNGALHWLSSEGGIVAFDLADEEFRCFPTPPCSVSNGGNLSIWVLGGCLCLVDQSLLLSADQSLLLSADIWFLKKEEMQTTSSTDDDVVKEYAYQSWSWSREFTISFKHIHEIRKPFAITKRGEILHWYASKTIISSDLKTMAEPKQLGEVDDYMYGLQTIPHVNSFVSLKALGENAAIL